MRKPQILAPGKSVDFHDSSLVKLEVDSNLQTIKVVLSVPDGYGNEQLWQVTLSGILSFDFEITGDGFESNFAPIEIYAVYEDPTSREAQRWTERLRVLDADSEARHVMFSSSFVRGWGENEEQDGISIVCRDFAVEAYSPGN